MENVTTREPMVRQSGSPIGASDWLEFEASTFRNNFNRRGFLVNHSLAGYPLFELPRLIELSKQLPEEHVSYSSGDVALTTVLHQGPRNGLSVAETIRQIEECRSWMVLKFVEQDPEYAALLNACLDQIQQFSEPLDPGMYRRQGFIFISSPNSLTPFHLDPEYNFLLQIRGEKEINLWPANDQQVVSRNDLEGYLSGERTHLTYREEFQERAEVFKLTPGRGLHFPAAAPHWVQNGPAVSISFSITFLTPKYARQATVSSLNESLRRHGITTMPMGQSKLYDTCGYYAFQAWLSARKLLKGQANLLKTDHR